MRALEMDLSAASSSSLSSTSSPRASSPRTSWFSSIVRGRTDRSGSLNVAKNMSTPSSTVVNQKKQFQGVMFKYGTKPIQWFNITTVEGDGLARKRSIHKLQGSSLSTTKNQANVCCVQFSAHSPHLLVVGSADFNIYCYDIRHTRIPWCTLAGHGKAISYVKFLDSETLVSASIDNTLKLWDLKKSSLEGLSSGACTMTFRGHSNEKNFIGLSVLDGYISCGSETNEIELLGFLNGR